jgi:hypothetical protein
VSVGGQVGAPSAWVKVGENDVAGMRLHFRQDLGVAASEAFDVKAPIRQAALRTFFLAVDLSRGFSFGEWISTEGGQPAQRNGDVALMRRTPTSTSAPPRISHPT